MDGRIEGIPAAYLGRAIAAFKTGGVGFYVNRKNDFVHADVRKFLVTKHLFEVLTHQVSSLGTS